MPVTRLSVGEEAAGEGHPRTYAPPVTEKPGGARVAAVVPAFGSTALTTALVGDLLRERELVDVFVVDNGGDFVPTASESVIKPPFNLGWAAGCNLGVQEALSERDYDAVVLLNNDTRLSVRFVEELLVAMDTSGAGLVGPSYDGAWWHQKARHRGPASDYRPRRRLVRANFVDGTCMLIRRTTVERVGLLDADAFGATGWGADVDYAIRVRRGGDPVVVTRAAFLRHAEAASAKDVFGAVYLAQGLEEMRAGLERKYGPDWSLIAGTNPPWWLRSRNAARRRLSQMKQGLLRGLRSHRA